jgi:hypothetical protein
MLGCYLSIAALLAVPITLLIISIADSVGKADLKDQLTQARISELATRQTARELKEQALAAKVAHGNNAVVLQDVELEIKQAKLKLLKQKLGETDKPFRPEEY